MGSNSMVLSLNCWPFWRPLPVTGPPHFNCWGNFGGNFKNPRTPWPSNSLRIGRRILIAFGRGGGHFFFWFKVTLADLSVWLRAETITCVIPPQISEIKFGRTNSYSHHFVPWRKLEESSAELLSLLNEDYAAAHSGSHLYSHPLPSPISHTFKRFESLKGKTLLPLSGTLPSASRSLDDDKMERRRRAE